MSSARGVLYVKWGSKKDAVLQRSIASLHAHHPELPIHVQELAADSSLLAKAKLFSFSPFEQTLFLDADTVVLSRLDYGFTQAGRHGLACCINENPYARRYLGLSEHTDLVEYNTGVLFFTRAAAPVFQRWAKVATEINSRMPYLANDKVHYQICNDQAGFAKAVDEIAVETGRTPFVLPSNWNFRPSWQHSFFGELKIWHDNLPPGESLERWCAEQTRPGAITEFVRLQESVPVEQDAPGGKSATP